MICECGDGTFVISSRGAWLPGTYDSRQAANYAFRLPDEALSALAASARDEGRVITMDDLRRARAEGTS